MRLKSRTRKRESESELSLRIARNHDRYYFALLEIERRDPVDLALDPQWPQRIAREAIERTEHAPGRTPNE